MTCKQIMRTKTAELRDDPEPYFTEMKEAWLEYIENIAEEYFDEYINNENTIPNLEEFINYADEEAEEHFQFKDYEDWFTDEVSGACDDYEDMKYSQWKDEK